MSFEEFLEIIQESKIQQILIKHGFRIIDKNYELNDGYHDHYLVGFESETCKLGFYYEPGGGISIIVGVLSNSFEDDKAEWVGLEYIIAFLLKRPIKRGPQQSDLFLKTKLAKELSELAFDFETLGDQIIEMFKDNKTVAQWKPELENYIKEDTKRRYGLK